MCGMIFQCGSFLLNDMIGVMQVEGHTICVYGTPGFGYPGGAV